MQSPSLIGHGQPGQGTTYAVPPLIRRFPRGQRFLPHDTSSAHGQRTSILKRVILTVTKYRRCFDWSTCSATMGKSFNEIDLKVLRYDNCCSLSNSCSAVDRVSPSLPFTKKSDLQNGL